MSKANQILLLKSLIIISILFCFGLYDNYNNGEKYRLEQRKNNEWNFGGLVVKKLDKTSFYAESRNDTVVGINYYDKVPEGDSLKIGDLITMKSVHLNADTVDIKFLHISRTRHLKIIFSVIPVIILTFLFFKTFTFDKTIKRFKLK